MMRRLVWSAVGLAAVAIGVVATPFLTDGILFKLWLAVCVLVAGSLAGIYYEGQERPMTHEENR
jgi:hypothetical protein